MSLREFCYQTEQKVSNGQAVRTKYIETMYTSLSFSCKPFSVKIYLKGDHAEFFSHLSPFSDSHPRVT